MAPPWERGHLARGFLFAGWKSPHYPRIVTPQNRFASH